MLTLILINTNVTSFLLVLSTRRTTLGDQPGFSCG